MEQSVDMKDLIKCYIDFIDIKAISKLAYKKQLDKFYDYLVSVGKQNNPDRSDVKAYKEYLSTKVHSASIAQALTAIRGFYVWIYDQGLGTNIASGIKAPSLVKTFKREPLTLSQAKKLVSKASKLAKKTLIGKRNYAIICLLLTTGLRTIEIERANTEDLTEINEGKVLYIQGKGHDDKDRYVKISPFVYTAIENYLIARNDDAKPLFMVHGNHQSNVGNPEHRIRTKDVRTVVKEMLRRIDLDSKVYSAHSLRHSVATLNLEFGGTLEETQELLRHVNISTTMIYSHHIKREKNNSELRVSDLIFGNKR